MAQHQRSQMSALICLMAVLVVHLLEDGSLHEVRSNTFQTIEVRNMTAMQPMCRSMV